MKIEQVLETYDQIYAEAYNQKFLFDKDISSELKLKSEIAILTTLLAEQGKTASWLDVACGTGYFLSHFSEVQRMGLDLSPNMLSVARQNNPEVKFVEGDFRNRSLISEGRFNLISSMWWAYSLVESMSDIEKLISNIAAWLTVDGICFMPIGEPSQNLFDGKLSLPYIATEDAPAFGGRILITGVTWSWIEPDGKRHDHMVLPQVEQLIEMFKKYFEHVEIVHYAYAYRAIIATRSTKPMEGIQAQLTALIDEHVEAPKPQVTQPQVAEPAISQAESVRLSNVAAPNRFLSFLKTLFSQLLSPKR